jgi:hypothetical protein
MVHRKLLLVGLAAALLTLVGSASPAQAQRYRRSYYAQGPRGVYRAGVVFGLSLGIGGISASSCGDVCGFSGLAEVHIGGMIAPNVAVLGDFWEGLHYFSGVPGLGSGETWNGIYTLALQYWPLYNIWFKGGLGFGRLQLNANASSYYGYYYSVNVDDETGFAFMLAAGIELLQSYNWAMDLQLRYGNVAYGGGGNSAGDLSMYALMLGFNWY